MGPPRTRAAARRRGGALVLGDAVGRNLVIASAIALVSTALLALLRLRVDASPRSVALGARTLLAVALLYLGLALYRIAVEGYAPFG